MYNGHIKYLNTEYLALVIVSIIFPYNDLDNTLLTVQMKGTTMDHWCS